MDQVEVNVGIDTAVKTNIIDSKCLERVGSILIHWETCFEVEPTLKIVDRTEEFLFISKITY